MADPAGSREERLRADLTSLRIERTAKPAPPRSRGRKPIWIALAVVIVLALVAAWLFSGGSRVVTVAYATRSTPGTAGQAALLSGSGYVVTGDRYISIGVRVPGRIEKYFIEEGQHVTANEPLVQLDDRDYRAAEQSALASLDVARANLELADAELRRGRSLRGQGVISDQELDVLQNKASVTRATVAQLEAALAQARVNLEYTVLRAPTDGVVLAKLKEVGEIAVPGGFAGAGDLVRLANLSDMRAEVDVNEADLARVRMGGPAEVTPDAYPDLHYKARVVKLYPQVDRQKGTLKVEVQIIEPNERLLPDMSARIAFLDEEASPGEATESVVMAPAAAVRKDGDESYVWVVENQKARKVAVEVGSPVGDRLRITQGLKGGEAVITGEPPTSDGESVKIEGME